MKLDKIIYWVSTSIVSLGMLASSYMYMTQSPQLVEGFKAVALPLYLVPLLGLTKLLGAIALIIPSSRLLPSLRVLKEWAYAGFTFMFLGAAWVHLSTGTPFVSPLVMLVLLAVSYWFKKRIASHHS